MFNWVSAWLVHKAFLFHLARFARTDCVYLGFFSVFHEGLPLDFISFVFAALIKMFWALSMPR